MPLVAAPASAAKATRKPSLKEQPSYLKVVLVVIMMVVVVVVVVMVVVIGMSWWWC